MLAPVSKALAPVWSNLSRSSRLLRTAAQASTVASSQVPASESVRSHAGSRGVAGMTAPRARRHAARPRGVSMLTTVAPSVVAPFPPGQLHDAARSDHVRADASAEHSSGRDELWWLSHSRREVLVARDFETVYGDTLPEVRLTVEQWGDTSLGPDRTIAIFPSFSHGPHVAANAADPSPGWWDGMLGPGRWLDTNRFRVVSISPLGSPFGATSPRSEDPRTGRPYRMSFPTITTADMARANALALDRLGLSRVHAVVGASLGGMQVLQFATLFPGRADRIAVLVSTPRTSPASVAVRRLQRQAILSDPDFRGGDYDDAPGPHPRGPTTGLRLAREIGTLAYRSREEFDERFDWTARGQGSPEDVTFEVESYLRYQGAKFARSGAMDANSYLKLSKVMDLHDIANPRIFPGRSFEEAAGTIQADALLIGVKQDTLTPAHELRHLADAMAAAGRSAEFVQLSSPFGHDAFLKEYDFMGPLLRSHVERGIERELELEEVHNTGLSHP